MGSRVVAVTQKGGAVFTQVFQGNNVWEQQMHDAAEAVQLKKMLESNPQLSPFEVFCKWLEFRFPSGMIAGRTREERMQPIEGEKFIQ